MAQNTIGIMEIHEMKRYEVIYKMGARLEGPYSYIVLAQNGNAAIDKFKKEWKGFRTYVCEVREVA